MKFSVSFGGGLGGSNEENFCENPVRFSMNDSPIETAEYIWVNIK